MLAQHLMLIAAGIVLAMGSGHMVLTFFSRAFFPRDETLKEKMQSTAARFNTRMQMWNAWIGFNASHSMGPMLFGLIYGYLSLMHPEFLLSSQFLMWLGAAALAFYLFLAMRYWFYLPLIGITVSLSFYIAGMLTA